MWPNIFTIGTFSLKTITVFFLVALFISAFIFWKKGKEEHYNEFELMDVFFQALVAGLVAGRIGYVVHYFPTIGFNVLSWFDIFTYPGIHGLSALLVAGLTLYRVAKKKKWDAFEILDFWVISLAYGLSVIFLGLFFDGTYYGYETQLPIGVLFPGLFTKHHPLQIYVSLLFFISAFYLSKVEYRYRTFEWYRAGKKAAQTGFLVSVFCICAALTFLMVYFLKPSTMALPFIELIEYALVLLFGIVLLWNRSGRTLPGKKT